VSAEVPRSLGGYKIKGVVKKALRSVMNNRIEFRINNALYVFQEPTLIVERKGSVSFIYGEEDKETDEDIFEGLRDIAMSGGNIDDLLAATKNSPVRIISFKVSEK
jgi:hypothetical protein